MSTAPARRRVFDVHSPTFHSFADMLYIGLLVAAASLPVVTAFAAFSAGVEVLRDARRSDGHVTVAAFWRTALQRVRRHWVSHLLVPLAIALLLLFNTIVLPWTGVPPEFGVGAPIVLAVIAGTLGLRFAGGMRTGAATRRVWERAFAAMHGDPLGTLLLAGAVVTAAAVVGMAPMLGFIIAGPLALAAVAIDLRSKDQP